MVKFEELGFESFEQYVNHFFGTLLLSNKTYEYFVDWNKVRGTLNKYLDELSLLNSLTKVSAAERRNHLQNLLLKHPRIIEVIPMLIAERAKNGKLDIFDPKLEEFMSFEFKQSKVNEKSAHKVIEFCSKTGIIDLFQEIKDVYDYLLGVEVGLDTNARKNRSGEIFENMCQEKIGKLIEAHYRTVNNDPKFSLYPILTKGKSKGKTHDIVVYKNDEPVLIVECNFYNVTGSKPISIAESYIEMHRIAKEQKINFLWVTDGPAWYKMKESLIRSMNEIDFILNYRMLNLIKNILK
ncbi:MAG: DpnII family type II restriction endonuclease [Thermoproteota archaeon]